MKKTSLKIKNGVTIITSEIEINAPKSTIWSVLKDIGEIEKFHPLVKKSKTISDALSGPGAKRHCTLSPMGQMVEQVVEWNEGNAFVLEVVGGKMLPPYRFMRGRIELEALNEKTKVTFSFSYRLKYGFLGKAMDFLLIRPQFKKAPPKYVAGLKEYVERQHR